MWYVFPASNTALLPRSTAQRQSSVTLNPLQCNATALTEVGLPPMMEPHEASNGRSPRWSRRTVLHSLLPSSVSIKVKHRRSRHALSGSRAGFQVKTPPVRSQNINTGEYKNLSHVESLVHRGEAAFIGDDRKQWRFLQDYEQKRLRWEILKASEQALFDCFTEGETKRRVWQTLNTGRNPMSDGPKMRVRQFAPVYVPPPAVPVEA